MLFPIKKVRASSICSSAFCNRRRDVPLPGKITDCDHCEQVGHVWAIDQEGGCSDVGPRVADWNDYFVDLNSLDRYLAIQRAKPWVTSCRNSTNWNRYWAKPITAPSSALALCNVVCEIYVQSCRTGIIHLWHVSWFQPIFLLQTCARLHSG